MTLSPALTTILLLIGSNLFMTFAWYGHLRFKPESPWHDKLWLVVLASWGIAFFEYCLMVPANRIGYTTFSAAQLKTLQEVITLVVFVLFSWLYLGEALKWQTAAGFTLIACGAAFVFYKP